MTSVLPKSFSFENLWYDLREQGSFPEGYSLYQLKDDYAIWGNPRDCAYGGCPAQVPMLTHDQADVEFHEAVQMWLMACNEGMDPDAVAALMGNEKVFMNGTGICSTCNKRNYITGNGEGDKNPYTDKFRSMNLNTHLGRVVDGNMYPLALDGRLTPAMKPGRERPHRVEDCHIDDYVITPKTHPWFFIRCTNVKWKPDTRTLDYGPFAGGIWKEWMLDDDLPHTYFPFTTTRHTGVATPEEWWRKLEPGEPFPSAVRRG